MKEVLQTIMARLEARFAHAPIHLDLKGEITDMQKLDWMIRGGLVMLGVLLNGSRDPRLV